MDAKFVRLIEKDKMDTLIDLNDILMVNFSQGPDRDGNQQTTCSIIFKSANGMKQTFRGTLADQLNIAFKAVETKNIV